MSNMLRPMNTAELLDRTFFLYRKHFTAFAAIVAIPNLLPLGFNLATIKLRSSLNLQQTLIFTLISAILYLLTVSTAQAATIAAVSEVHLDRPVRIGAAFLRAKECLAEILVIAVMMGIGILLGTILLIIPGILLALAWSLAIPAAIIETRGPFDAMRRSWALTRESRFRIFIVLFMVTVLAYIVSTLFQMPMVLAIFTIRIQTSRMLPAWVGIYSTVASFVSTSLVLPISTIASSLIYYDQRVRKEGFDIQFMLSSLKKAGTESVPPGKP